MKWMKDLFNGIAPVHSRLLLGVTSKYFHKHTLFAIPHHVTRVKPKSPVEREKE